MSAKRKEYVALIDAGVKKWTAYIDKEKKGSKRYIWGYRRFGIAIPVTSATHCNAIPTVCA